MRKTFGNPDRPLIDVRVQGVAWGEVLEACKGFLDDEGVAPGFFAAADLELLARLVQGRLHQVSTHANLPCRCGVCQAAVA